MGVGVCYHVVHIYERCVSDWFPVWGCLAVCKHTGSVNVEMKFLKGFVVISSDLADCIVWVKCTTYEEC